MNHLSSAALASVFLLAVVLLTPLESHAASADSDARQQVGRGTLERGKTDSDDEDDDESLDEDDEYEDDEYEDDEYEDDEYEDESLEEDEDEPLEDEKAKDEPLDDDEECSSAVDCTKGQICKAGECVEAPVEEKKDEPVLWLALGLIQDAAFVSGNQVCTEASQLNDGYTCLRPSGSQYHGRPVPGQGGTIDSGVSLASTRVTLASHLRVVGPLSLGVRLGYVFAGAGPRPDGGEKYLRLHGEAIGALWLTGDALSTRNFGFFLELSGGIAEVDGKKSVTVRTDQTVPPPPSQLDNPELQELDVYTKAGTGFVGGGVGAFIPMGDSFGLLSDLRLSTHFPTSGWALSLGISIALGI